MSYFLLFIVAIMWSFVSVMVKTAAVMFDSAIISFSRFFFGIVFLFFFIYFKEKNFKLTFRNKWIWIGAIGKSFNYILENYALKMGFVYGHVIIWPLQAIFLSLAAYFVFKEKMNSKKILSIFLCLIGVTLVSWAGRSPSEIFSTGMLPTLLMALAALGAAIHVFTQKKLVETMEPANMNFTVFLICSFITLIPLPFSFERPTVIYLPAIFSLVGLGLITGISFYIYSRALKKVSLIAAVFISNSTVLFTLLWARLFFNETINAPIIAGSVILLLGLVTINFSEKKTPS